MQVIPNIERITPEGLTQRLGPARVVRIANVARVARAAGHVTRHVAGGVGAAVAGTRVDALLADAGQVTGAVGGDDTLGPAAGRRAQVVGEAAAGATVLDVDALGVGAARARRAGVRTRRWRPCNGSVSCRVCGRNGKDIPEDWQRSIVK